MENELEISVYEAVGSNLCVASDDGQKVYDRLKAAIGAEKKTILSFRNVSILTSAFLNTAIGQLYGEFDEKKIRELLKVQEMPPEDTELLIRVVENVKDYFRDPEKFERAMREETE